MKKIRYIKIQTENPPTIWETIRTSLKTINNAFKEAFLIIFSPLLSIYQSFWPRSYDTTVSPEAEEFYWSPGGNPKKGVLFIHGFASSPQIFRKYGKMFLEKGYVVLGVRLEGHGTSVSHLASTNAVDWYLSAREKYFELQAECEEVSIVAHSLGTLLAIILASLYPIKSMILLSSPIYVRARPLYRVNFLLRPVSIFIKYWPLPKKQSKLLDKYGIYAYRKNPLRAVAGLFDCMQIAQERLPLVKCPVLLMLGDRDEHIDLSTLDYFKEHIGTEILDIWIAPDASHIITETPELETLENKIRDFMLKYNPPEDLVS
ncbi:MAG: alpha/beta fold hydrolase [Methanobacteriota archaeon]|nr:MAG: alpha/beta fold hydrolase [Euryarchaeota archaeon]